MQWSLNNTRNKTTRTSPSEIVFGRRTINPEEGSILNAIQDCSGKSDTEFQNNHAIDSIRNMAVKNTEESQNAMKAKYDSKKHQQKYSLSMT